MSSHCIYCTARGPAFITLMTLNTRYMKMKIKVQFFPNQSFTVSLSASVYQCAKCDLSHVPAPHLTSTWQGPSPPRTLHTPDPGDKSSSRVWRRRTQEKVTVSAAAASACIPSAPSSVAPVSLSAAAAATRGCQTTSLHENIFSPPLINNIIILTI